MEKSSIDRLVDDLINGIGACPILYIPHYDDSLIDRAINMSLGKLKEDSSIVSEWVCGIGEVDFRTKKRVFRDSESDVYQGVVDYLEGIVDKFFVGPYGTPKKVFIIKNLNLVSDFATSLLSEEATTCISLLQLSAYRYFNEDRDNQWCIILINSSGNNVLPQEISKLVTVINVYPPTFDEIKALVQKYKSTLNDEGQRELIRNLQGLDEYEIKQILNSITVFNDNQISSDGIKYALEEKKKLVRKYGVIEIIDADETFDIVGGMEVLRKDLKAKKIIFENVNRALDDGIQIPKGLLIIGMPGCGKTMIAKAIANEFGRIPLLRLDMNRVLGSYVGESEQNMNKVLLAAEAASPCVLWIDEIEKAFSGASSAGDSHNDTVLRMMGIFLTWMQEHKKPVYVVATANDVMRSELMRKGRFDEVYFVDFPTQAEIVAILKNKIDLVSRSHNYSGSVLFNIDELSKNVESLAKAASGFTGAELQSAINSLVESAYIRFLTNNHQVAHNNEIKLSKDELLEVIKSMQNNITKKQEADKNSSVAKLQEYRNLFKNASAV